MLHAKAMYVDVMEVEGARVYTFRASTNSVDRQNEVLDQSGWQLDNYRANPVILDSHRYESVYDIIGRATRVEVVDGALEVDVIFADDDVEELVNKGFLRTVSVGFRSLARRPGATAIAPVTHTQMELLEVSMVAIPANRDAVRLRSLVDAEGKAGRRLSAATQDAIQQAIDLLASLLDQPTGDPAGDPMEAGNKPKPKAADEDHHQPGQEPAKPKFTVPDEVAAKLAAFAKEATNG